MQTNYKKEVTQLNSTQGHGVIWKSISYLRHTFEAIDFSCSQDYV
jgi:hypothetical protein